MKNETAKRVLLYAGILLLLNVAVTAGMAVLAYVFLPTIVDLMATVVDPTALAFIEFIELYPELLTFIPIGIGFVAVLQLVYLAVILYWRTDPLKHTTGLSIVGVLNLIVGFNLSGLLILLAGLLVEE
jgi:hypothetical protein